MKVVMNIEKRHVYFLVASFVLMASMLAVNALNSGNPNIMGHTADEVPIDLSNYYTKSEVDATVTAVAADLVSSLECTYAYRNASNTVVVLDGNPSAVAPVGTGAPSGNVWWGIKCVDPYKKTGCHLSSIGDIDVDFDLHPSKDSCLTDDEEFAASVKLSIICCK